MMLGELQSVRSRTTRAAALVAYGPALGLDARRFAWVMCPRMGITVPS